MKHFLLLIILFSVSALAEEQKVVFNPIASINARSIQKGTLSLSKSPLNNLNSVFIANTLNYGLFSRMEIGTAPLYYLTPEHKYNYMAKINFWRGDWVDWALSVGDNVYRTKIQDYNGKTERPDLKMTATQIAMNLHPPGTQWAMGVSVTQSCGYIDSKNALTKVYSLKCAAETGFDVQYEHWDQHWISVGYGRMRSAGLTPYEDLTTGLGAAYTWKRSGKFFSRPSLGYYQNFNGEHFVIANTTFYEM